MKITAAAKLAAERKEDETMEYLVVYLSGAALYGLLELSWRGWTHWTMLLCGGFCFTLMYFVSMSVLPLWRKCLLCAAAITTV